MHARMIRPSSSRKPSIDPMTIPAIAPALRPCVPPPDAAASALELLLGEEVGLAVDEKTSAIEENTGNVTS